MSSDLAGTGKERNIEVPQQVKLCANSNVSGCLKTYDLSSYTRINLCSIPKAKLMYLNVNINGVEVQGLVDTGAQRTLVHYSIVKMCGLEKFIDNSQQFKLKAIGEVEGIVTDGMISITFAVNNIVMESITCLVVPNSIAMSNPIILGMDFLSENRLLVNPSKRLITRELKNGTKCDIYLSEKGQYEKTMLRSVRCVAVEKVSLAPGETKRVEVESIDPDLEEYFLGHRDLLYCEMSPKKKFKVTSGIVSSDSLSMVVSETRGKPMHIQQGDVVGVVSTVHIIDEEDQPDESWTYHRIKEEVTLPDLTDSQRERVWSMISQSKSCLSKNSQDVGMAAITAHTIRLHDETPIYQRPRRFPEPITEEIERQCLELYDMDIIEPSTSAFASPVVPVRKSDGTIRLCVDYRKLNQVTKPDRSPIPNLTDSVYGLHGNRFFTSLDLVKGFYHIPIDDDSREYTAFVTSRSHWQFKRLSFGLRNAPVTFQREIQAILEEFPWKKVIVYIDDILIMEESFEAHLLLVQKVQATLERYVKIKPDKCQWFSHSVDFLGHTISREGLRKQQIFIEKVDQFPRPQTVTELREFLGLVNFQRKFVKDASSIQKPLSELTGGKKKTRIMWSPERVQAFEKLKELMREDVLLSFPNYRGDAEPMELWVDASSVGAGACLRQRQDDMEKIIAYASMTFNDAQKKYSTIDRELAALRWGVKTFRSFLYGIPFVLKTDHQPLIYLHNMMLVDSRLARTLEDLAEFNFTIEYAPGTTNLAADALSRMRGVPQKEHDEQSGGLPDGLELEGDAVPGGGDSLFISLRRALDAADISQVPATVQLLRELLIDELLKTPVKYGLTEKNRSLKRDLRLMRHPHQLPCLEVLLAASYIYNVTIFVYFWSKDPVVYYDSRTNKSTNIAINLQCLGGIHFNALKSLNKHETCENLKHVTIATPQEVESSDDVGEEIDMNVCRFCDYSGHPRIKVGWKDWEFCAILDTGAETSLIRESLCVIMGVHLNHENEVLIAGFSGLSSTTSTTVNLKLNFLKGVSTSEHTFVVVKDEVIPNCSLLGVDFLSVQNITIDCVAKKCSKVQGVKTTVPLMSLSSLERKINTLTAGEPDTCSGQVSETLAEGDFITSFIDVDSIIRTQCSNPYISEVKGLVETGVPVSEWPDYLGQYKSVGSKLKVVERILCHSSGSHRVAVVSLDLLVDIAIAAHYSMIHIGRDKLVHLVKRHVWHPKLYAVCRDICVTCRHCQLMKVARQLHIPPTRKIQTNRPFELMATDLVVFPKAKDGWIGCVVLIDHNSKWLAAVPIKSKSTLTVCSALEHQIFPFLPRLPERLLSDNGLEFVSKDFANLMSKYLIKHILTTPYKPSSNGCVERANRTLGDLLRSAEQMGGDWRRSLSRAIMVYNGTRHRELNQSPSEYLLSRSHPIKDAVLVSETDARFWKAGHPKFIPFSIGQHVLRKIPRHGHSAAQKFYPKYEGPFKVIAVNDNGVTYDLVKVDSELQIRAHHTQLIPWTAPPDYLRDRLNQFEDRQESEDEESESSSGEFLGFPVVSTTTESSGESSDSTVDFGLQSSWRLSVREDSTKLDQIDGTDGEAETDVESSRGSEKDLGDGSVVFGNGDLGTADQLDIYQLCHLGSESEDMEVGTIAASRGSLVEGSGVILSPQEEFWELSSVAEPEDGPAKGPKTAEDLLDQLEEFVGGTMDTAFARASEAVAQMVSFVSSKSDEFGGFDLSSSETVGTQRVKALKNIIGSISQDNSDKGTDRESLSPEL